MNNETIKKALEIFGIDAREVISPLQESADNAVFIIGTKDKSVLRVSKRLPVEDIVFEHEAVNHLARGGVLVPHFLPTRSGEYYVLIDDAVAVLFDFIEGHHIKVDKDHLPTPQLAFEAGKGLAEMHNVGRNFAPSAPRRRTIFSELERALSFEEIFIGQFEGGNNFINQVKSAIDLGKAQLEATGLIHNDYRPNNVFFDDTGHIVGIIDFDWSCVGPIVKDVALGVLEWSFPDGAPEVNSAIFDAFLWGYNWITDQKQMKNRRLYDWIAFAALSDAATYLCDLIEDRTANKRIISSYMYQKYLFFAGGKS